jgi:hypothetical protein
MDEPHFIARNRSGPEGRSYCKMIHHSPFFWMAAFFILLSMAIYVGTQNLSLRPGHGPQEPMTAVVP